MHIIFLQNLFKIIIINFLFIKNTQQQSHPTWVTPPQLYTSTFDIDTQSARLIRFSNQYVMIKSNITFPADEGFLTVPHVALAFTGFQTIPVNQRVFISINVQTVSMTDFSIKIILQNKTNNIGTRIRDQISIISLSYIAYSRTLYNGINIYNFPYIINHIDNLNNPRSQVKSISYLQNLPTATASQYILVGSVYQIDFRVYSSASNSSYFQIKLLFKDATQYFVLANANEYTQIYNKIGITRILIQKNKITGLNIGTDKDDYQVQSGIVQHYKPINQTVSVSGISYYKDALFFGISKFQNLSFDLLDRYSIFLEVNQTSKRININIAYLIIMYRDCSSNAPSYDSITGLCFARCQPYFYEVSSRNCVACYYTCYTCLNSGRRGCTSCLQGWNRQLLVPNAGNQQCACSLGYYQPTSGSNPQICRLCSQVIQGCLYCNSQTQCTQCLNCSLIAPTICNCTNSGLPLCPIANQRLDLKSQQCVCIDQYFFNDIANQCQRCADPCYTCEFNSTFCSECISGYILLNNDCSFYQFTQFIIKGIPNYNTQLSRCITYSQDGLCFEQCPLNSSTDIYYNFSCYAKCPIGTFMISYPQYLCQQCPQSCYQCQDSSICLKCPTNFYYLNRTTYTCQTCDYGCLRCLNSTYCIQCIQTKQLRSNSSLYTSICVQSFAAYNNLTCPNGCSFCFVSSLCEQCQNNYFLTYNLQCISCQNQGLQLIQVQTSVQEDGYFSIYKKCVQKCGDGIIINDQCDDGNIRSNDGCSSTCQIEQGFLCQYISSSASKYSLCFSQNYSITYNIFRSLKNNSIIIQMKGNGIDLSKLPKILPKCSFSFKSSFLQSISPQILKYIIEYQQSLIGNEQDQCQISYENITNLTFSIFTFPTAIIIDYNSSIALIEFTTYQTIGKILLYMTLVLTVIGFTPYNIWIMLYSINCYVLTLYDFYNEPASLYIPQDYLKYFSFVYDNHKQGTIITPQISTLSLALLKMLLYFLIIIFLYEIIVNYLFTKIILSIKNSYQRIAYILEKLQQNRFLLYYSIHLSYQVVANFYIIHIVANMIQWINNNGINSQTQSQEQFNFLGVICGIIHILISILFPLIIYLLLLRQKLDNMQYKKHVTRQDHKYFIIYIICKAVNILLPFSIYFSSKEISSSSFILLWSSFVIAFILIINCNCGKQIMKQQQLKQILMKSLQQVKLLKSIQNQKYRQKNSIQYPTFNLSQQDKNKLSFTQKLFKIFTKEEKSKKNQYNSVILTPEDIQKFSIIIKHNPKYYSFTHAHVIFIMIILFLISLIRLINQCIILLDFQNWDTQFIINFITFAGDIINLLSLFCLIIGNLLFCIIFLVYRVKVWLSQVNDLYKLQQKEKYQQEIKKKKTKKNHFEEKIIKNISSSDHNNKYKKNLKKTNEYLQDQNRNQIFYEQQDSRNHLEENQHESENDSGLYSSVKYNQNKREFPFKKQNQSIKKPIQQKTKNLYDDTITYQQLLNSDKFTQLAILKLPSNPKSKRR